MISIVHTRACDIVRRFRSNTLKRVVFRSLRFRQWKRRWPAFDTGMLTIGTNAQKSHACAVVALILSCVCNSLVVAQTPAIKVSVNTSRLSRHLLESEIVIPVSSGRQVLWYPKWIPGIHGPGEQIRNIGGLRVTTLSGEPLRWTRDTSDLYRIELDVPEGEEAVRISLTYIANQPTRVSRGVDTYGNSKLLAINFNTCLLYPDEADVGEMPVELRLRLPDGWQYGTALTEANREDGWIVFEPASVETVIDSPLIAGQNYRRHEVKVDLFPDTRFHFVSESSDALDFDSALTKKLERLMKEAALLFGGAPYAAYDFLVICSDDVPRLGLEHHASSLNAISEDALIDEDKLKSTPATLLPHELVHAWCGKYRRPAGMSRSNYHDAKQTNLLWIYEGLTQYLGHVLSVRSGLLDFEDQQEMLAGRVGYLANRAGRNWRTLEDTAIAGHTLRGGSKRWNDLRRNQDYYDEGALFWMEVDLQLRTLSDGETTIDDFCQRFFASEPNDGTRDASFVKPYDLKEVVQVLAELQSHDWSGLIQRRIFSPQDALPLAAIEMAGYKFEYVAERSATVNRRESLREYISAAHSVGMTLSKDGSVTSVVPGSIADQREITEGMEIIGVNGKKFNEDRWRLALEETRSSGRLELLLFDDVDIKQVRIDYQGGPRYPAIVRDDEKVDWLKPIFTARSPHAHDEARDEPE